MPYLYAVTQSLNSRNSLIISKKWLGRELNPRHEDFQSSALPTELPSLKTILAFILAACEAACMIAGAYFLKLFPICSAGTAMKGEVNDLNEHKSENPSKSRGDLSQHATARARKKSQISSKRRVLGFQFLIGQPFYAFAGTAFSTLG